jgi:hypothetical protein
MRRVLETIGCIPTHGVVFFIAWKSHATLSSGGRILKRSERTPRKIGISHIYCTILMTRTGDFDIPYMKMTVRLLDE